MVTSRYYKEFNSFQIKEHVLPQEFKVVKQEDLMSPFVCHSLKFGDTFYIIMKTFPV